MLDTPYNQPFCTFFKSLIYDFTKRVLPQFLDNFQAKIFNINWGDIIPISQYRYHKDFIMVPILGFLSCRYQNSKNTSIGYQIPYANFFLLVSVFSSGIGWTQFINDTLLAYQMFFNYPFFVYYMLDNNDSLPSI